MDVLAFRIRCDGMNNRELQVYLRPILRWWWLIYRVVGWRFRLCFCAGATASLQHRQRHCDGRHRDF